jgi:hypothetical protein
MARHLQLDFNNKIMAKVRSFFFSICIISIGFSPWLYLFYLSLPSPPPEEEFTTDGWKNGSDSDRRLKMLPSLLRQNHLVGMTVEEVEALLGQPPQRELKKHGGGQYIYYLGDSSGHGSWDWPYLAIVFEQGRVRRVDQLMTFLGDIKKKTRQE